MRPIQHPPAIPSLLQRAISHGATRWDGRNRTQLRAQLRNELNTLQKGLCAYCQIRLDSEIGCHIEHIWPKHAHQTMTFQWNNLVLSCTDSQVIGSTKQAGGVSCGHSNGKQAWSAYDPRFISPTESDCERFLEYRASDGSVQPASTLSMEDTNRAIYTIDLLNFNCPRLCRLRKDRLEEGYRIISELHSDSIALKHFLNCEFAEVGGKLSAFFTARQQHFSPFA
jgi:uncharacterized protein (TIGR02646 family)